MHGVAHWFARLTAARLVPGSNLCPLPQNMYSKSPPPLKKIYIYTVVIMCPEIVKNVMNSIAFVCYWNKSVYFRLNPTFEYFMPYLHDESNFKIKVKTYLNTLKKFEHYSIGYLILYQRTLQNFLSHTRSEIKMFS
jgi:hypothetical protein